MKSLFTFVAGFCVLGLAVASAQPLNLPSAAPAAPAAPAAAAPSTGSPIVRPPAAPTQTMSDAQLLELIGWIFGVQNQIETFGFTPAEMESVAKGMAAAAAEKDMRPDLERAGAQLEAFTEKRNLAYVEKLKAKGLRETKELFDRLRASGSVTFLPSGVAYEIRRQGTGAMARPTDTLTAHYTASFADGRMLDTTRVPEPGVEAKPVEMALANTLPGLTEALQKINKGGQIRIYLPPEAAFGPNGNEEIPPNSSFIWDIDVLDIKPTPGPASLAPMTTPPGAPAAK